MTAHILAVTADRDPEFQPDVDIECPGVTDACAEWIESDSPGVGEETRTIQGDQMVRSGFCFVENYGHAVAIEFIERHGLGSGRHSAIPEFQDDTLVDFAPMPANPGGVK